MNTAWLDRFRRRISPTAASLTQLLRWNQVLTIVYVAQAIALLLLASARTFPLTASYFQTDRLTSAAQGSTAVVPVLQQIGELQLSLVVAAFLLLAAAAHASMAFWGRDRYETNLKAGISRFRWVEYACSAGLMLVTVAVVVGASDASLLLTLLAFAMVTNLTALAVEMRNAHRAKREPLRWGSFWLAGVTGLMPWVVIGCAALANHNLGDGVSGYAWAIAGTTFVLFGAYPAFMALHYRQISYFSSYMFTEKAYFGLSFVAKTALAWLVYAGFLR